MSEKVSLVERVAKDFTITEAEMGELWAEFDRDKSGSLSLEESKGMLGEFLVKVLGKVAGSASCDRMMLIAEAGLKAADAEDGKADGKLSKAAVQGYLNLILSQEKQRLSQMAGALLSRRSKYENTEEWADYLAQLVPVLVRIQHPQAEELRSLA